MKTIAIHSIFIVLLGLSVLTGHAQPQPNNDPGIHVSGGSAYQSLVSSNIGTGCNATGANAFAGGHQSMASGTNAFAFGNNSRAGGNAFALGCHAVASDTNSISLGFFTSTASPMSLVIGSGYDSNYPLASPDTGIFMGMGSTLPTLFPMSELIVLYEADTLFHHINKWRFPCIGFYNDAYTDCYLREPESLEDFLLFCYYCDSIDDGNDGLYDNCNKQTVENLQKCKQLESFQWINSEDELLIVIDNDTVWRHNALLPCNEDLKWLFYPHYYDKKGHYIKLEENVNRDFKNSLREIGRPFFIQSSQEIHYYIFVYNNTSGIYPFCKEDDLDTSTKYFKDMGSFLEKFVEENGLRKIIFIAPATEKIK